jgi:hypothetical protein
MIAFKLMLDSEGWREFLEKLQQLRQEYLEELLDSVISESPHMAAITAGKIVMLMDLIELPSNWLKEDIGNGITHEKQEASRVFDE